MTDEQMLAVPQSRLELERERDELLEALLEKDRVILKLQEEAGRLKARLVLIAEYARKI